MKKPCFSRKTIPFILKASRQKNADWLDRNREQYEQVLLHPLQNLARHLKTELSSEVPDYHFPLRGIGRLKRIRGAEDGTVFKNWISYSAARPRTSRFEHNPNLFFLINTEDSSDPVLTAGGLYFPSSKQTRAIREYLGETTEEFQKLFKSNKFRNAFPNGFSKEKISSRIPRGFPADHPHLEWIRLQAFFVWKPYSKSVFYSKNFPEIVESDWRQIIRLNRLLEKIISGKPFAKIAKITPKKVQKLSDRLQDLTALRTEMDF